MRKLMIGVAAALTFVAAPALALEVTASKTIPAQAGAVWTAMGDFCGVANWHPAEARNLKLECGTLNVGAPCSDFPPSF